MIYSAVKQQVPIICLDGQDVSQGEEFEAAIRSWKQWRVPTWGRRKNLKTKIGVQVGACSVRSDSDSEGTRSS